MNCFAAHKQRHWPGTSKWNKIEHRLFSHITMNWRGRPLTSHEVIVQHHRRHHHPHRADGARRAGHRQLPHRGHDQRRADGRPAAHPPRLARRLELHPAPRAAGTAATAGTAARPRTRTPGWAHPALTGLTAADWDQLIAALAVPYQAQRDAGLHIARGGPPARRPAGGHPPAPHPRRKGPGHRPAPAIPHPPARPCRTVRRRHRHHRHSRTPDPAAAGPARPTHRARRHPAHHPRRPHRLRSLHGIALTPKAKPAR